MDFIIPHDDSWWDDLATPLTREQMERYCHRMSKVYDTHMSRPPHAERKYTVVEQIQFREITHQYTVIGIHAPVLIKTSQFYRGNGCATTKNIIVCDLITRGELVKKYYRAMMESGQFIAHNVIDDMQEELSHRGIDINLFENDRWKGFLRDYMYM